MAAKCLVEEAENRELDSYDLIEVLELVKDHRWQEIWRRYSRKPGEFETLNFELYPPDYFIQMTVQQLTSLALSAKYNVTPYIMQALIRRVLLGHRHGLILTKLSRYGVPVAADHTINLSCSIGTVGIDLLVSRDENAQEYRFRRFGTSRVEQDEQRPLDHYDMVAILLSSYLNLTAWILDRYVPQEILNEGIEEEKVVRFSSPAGDYLVDFLFHRIKNDVTRELPPRGNVSVGTMHQVITRLFAGHDPALITKELTSQGIIINQEEAARDFTLARYLNDNYIEMRCRRKA
ncbi:MAG: hypothetical protein JRI57_05555 [Deltaproteobacteria bacterium]|nr:hypothetical protein [Deltaproteobacteria bacterium]MBW1951553.1 hypothetical protein [Deltaproteobacteria bacterium]MBW1986800.1 hypothetical protein [Deltaproteobacteria bacterium]MBW2135220.1 hypothetical protein [Deltaproteobacteria bacterium]